MRVEESFQRRMRVAFAVNSLMVATVGRHPFGRASLHRHRTHPRQQTPEPRLASVTVMRQQAMVSESDAETGDEVEENQQNQINRTRRKPKSEQAEGMKSEQNRAIDCIEAPRPTVSLLSRTIHLSWQKVGQ